MIGIRQADGSFYEILDETAAGHKRLILSAARTDQKGVRIELFRSTDGTISPDGSLGEITLEDAEGLGYQDIEFRLDVADGRLDASAALPGQSPRKLSVELGDGPHRTDAAILEDDDLGAGLDTLDASFLETEPEAEPATLDLPDLRDDEPEVGAAPESFDMPELDDFELPGLDEPAASAETETESEDAIETEAAASESEDELASFDMPAMDDMPALDEPFPAAEEAAAEEPEEFSMDDFGSSEPEAVPEAAEDEFSMDAFDDSEPVPVPSLDEAAVEPDVAAPLPEAETEDPFSINDLGDMEPMEFMDTGDELSAPAPRAEAPAKASAESEDFDISMDTDSSSEFGDLNEMGDLPDTEFGDLGELGDLPDMDEKSSTHNTDDDLDFMAPPELTETPWAEPDADEAPLPARGSKSKPPKPGKAPKSRRSPVPEPASGGGLDKTALFLSLTSLSLLVLLILVLLFLNMVKSPQQPAIQPEVMKFTPAQPLAQRVAPTSVDLAKGVKFEASTVLEVPAALKTAEVSLTLAPGDTAADAQRRFGAPATTRGNQLFW